MYVCEELLEDKLLDSVAISALSISLYKNAFILNFSIYRLH